MCSERPLSDSFLRGRGKRLNPATQQGSVAQPDATHLPFLLKPFVTLAQPCRRADPHIIGPTSSARRKQLEGMVGYSPRRVASEAPDTCFSAAASFVLASALMPAGLYTIAVARCSERAWPAFVAFSLAFRPQQGLEYLVRLGNAGDTSKLKARCALNSDLCIG